ncbi:unnamed protein product [Sphenostylis stenocarpa]|uniref:Sieve element occlusion N-terminal domain-containing protein n=1 Tax=Sphenostylis stenocarpa TaxID=92480 RepID=A0AA86RYB7_9FABA|nr:unnamed protein product [Sphenostylis stenocarpa]
MMPASVMSDEDRIWMKRLVAKHKPDGIDYDIKPIFGIVEDTLTHCSILSFEDAIMDSLPPVEDRRHHPGYTKLLEAFSTKIELISSEISCKTLGGVDEHSTTVAIFDVLTMYNWDVKIVLALAAFTVTYGEFWLLVHVHGTYQLAQTLGILKQLPSIMEHASSLKPRFDTLNHLVNITLEVTKCIIGFHGLPTQYTTAYNYIPIACYWILRSIVACTAQIRSLTTLGILTSTDTWDLSSLSFRLINIIDHLSQELDSWRECIDKQPEMMSTGSASKMDDEAYAKLGDLLKKPHSDNMEVLKALIYEHDDILPLYDGLSKKRV